MPRICTHFPLLTVDNFFDNPDAVVRESESLTYGGPPNENWPGVRTQSLDEVSPEIYFSTLNKVLGLWYSQTELEKCRWECTMYFQKMYPPIKDNPSSPLNRGWVHRDYPHMATGVVYLTPGADPSTGTGLYTDPENLWSPGNNPYEGTDYHECKKKICGLRFDEAEVASLEAKKEDYDKRHQPDIIVSNRYNRLILFGEQYPHREEYLGSKVDGGHRLTLVFFLTDLTGVVPPLLRIPRGV